MANVISCFLGQYVGWWRWLLLKLTIKSNHKNTNTMEKIIRMLTLIFILLSTTVQAQWETFEYYPRIEALTFPTTDFGMAVSKGYFNQNDSTFSADSSAIVTLTDSGSTWNYSLVLPSILFTDIQHNALYTFYAVGLNATNDIGVFASTSDAGNNWDTTLLNAALFGLSFPSDSVGYLLTNDTFLYKTIDSGKTWAQLPHNMIDSAMPPTNSFFIHQKIHFIDDTTGFVILNEKFFKTIDGGLSWSLTNPIQLTSVVDFAFIKNDSIGYLVSEDFYSIKIHKSTDMGDNWTVIDSLTSAMRAHTISFPHRDTGYIGGFYMVYKTVDGGNSWQKQFSSSPWSSFYDWVADIYCVSPQECFAGGMGWFSRTFNGGDTVLTNIGELNQLRKKLSVYPSPTSGMVNLKTTEKLQSIEVYNLQGQKVQEIKPQKRSWELPEESGLYLIRLQDEEGKVYTEKVIKE